MTRNWRNQDQIRKWFLHSDIIMPEQHQEWFEKYLGRDDDFLFIIEEISEFPKPVGQISLYHIDWQERKAEFGRLLVGEPTARHKGIAKKATAILLDFAFQEWGIREIHLEVLRQNEPAMAIYDQLGFLRIAETNDRIEMVRGCKS